MFLQKDAGILKTRVFSRPACNRFAIVRVHSCTGELTASALANAVAAMPGEARATHSTHAGKDIPSGVMAVEVTPSIPGTSASGSPQRRPWSLTDAPVDANGKMFGWRTAFRIPGTFAAAGVAPFAYREDEGKLYVLLSIQRSTRGRTTSQVYTLLGGKLANADSKDSRRTAAREAHEETHRVLDEQRVLDALSGRALAYVTGTAAPSAAGAAVRDDSHIQSTAAGHVGAADGGGDGGAGATNDGGGDGVGVTTNGPGSSTTDTAQAAGRGAAAGGPLSGSPETSTEHSAGNPASCSPRASGQDEGFSRGDTSPSSSPSPSPSSSAASGVRPGRSKGGGASGGRSSGEQGYPAPAEYFESGRYAAFAMHLPDAWDLPERFADRIRAKQKHPEAAKAEGLQWVSVGDMAALREGGSLRDPRTGGRVKGHHFMVSLLRTKRDKAGVLTWLERLQGHLREWHGLPPEVPEQEPSAAGAAGRSKGAAAAAAAAARRDVAGDRGGAAAEAGAGAAKASGRQDDPGAAGRSAGGAAAASGGRAGCTRGWKEYGDVVAVREVEEVENDVKEVEDMVKVEDRAVVGGRARGFPDDPRVGGSVSAGPGSRGASPASPSSTQKTQGALEGQGPTGGATAAAAAAAKNHSDARSKAKSAAAAKAPPPYISWDLNGKPHRHRADDTPATSVLRLHRSDGPPPSGGEGARPPTESPSDVPAPPEPQSAAHSSHAEAAARAVIGDGAAAAATASAQSSERSGGEKGGHGAAGREHPTRKAAGSDRDRDGEGRAGTEGPGGQDPEGRRRGIMYTQWCLDGRNEWQTRAPGQPVPVSVLSRQPGPAPMPQPPRP